MLRKASFLLGDQSMKSFWIPDSSHSGPLASLALGQICLGIVPSLDLLRLQLDSEYCVSNDRLGRELTIALYTLILQPKIHREKSPTRSHQRGLFALFALLLPSSPPLRLRLRNRAWGRTPLAVYKPGIRVTKLPPRWLMPLSTWKGQTNGEAEILNTWMVIVKRKACYRKRLNNKRDSIKGLIQDLFQTSPKACF